MLLIFILVHWTKRVCRSIEKVAKNSRKYMLNAIADDIRRWNVEKYEAFFYSLHTRVEKFWHSLHFSNENQLLRLANIFCLFFSNSFHMQQFFFSQCNIYSCNIRLITKIQLEIKSCKNITKISNQNLNLHFLIYNHV